MVKLDVRLTRLQAALQTYLRVHTGETLSRERLCAAVWKMNFYPNSRTIDQTISVVRKHLEEEERIITVHGIGYRHELEQVGLSPRLAAGEMMPERLSLAGR